MNDLGRDLYFCALSKSPLNSHNKMIQNELSTLEEVKVLISNNQAVLLYFYNDNCAPCLSLRPKVSELLRADFPKMELAFVNSGMHPDIPASYNVFSNPTLILFFEGNEFRRVSKYISIPQLQEAIERPYRMIFD